MNSTKFPERLLWTADELLKLKPPVGRPSIDRSQAILRRIVSTAYYALFHAVVMNACEELFSRTSPRVPSAMRK